MYALDPVKCEGKVDTDCRSGVLVAIGGVPVFEAESMETVNKLSLAFVPDRGECPVRTKSE